MEPYYIFNKKLFVEKLQSYKKNFRVFYPCKVNSSDNVIRAVIESECGFEVDSIQMARHLVNTYLVNPTHILFNGLIRSKDTIKQAVDLGITFFAVDTMDSLKEFENVGNHNLSFIVRVSINSLINEMINPIEKWGATLLEAKIIAEYIKQSKFLSLVGFSFYYPQEFKTIQRIRSSIKKIIELSREYCKLTIDIGGGIDLDEVDEIIRDMPKEFDYIIEPGRHLVGDCFDLVCDIIDYKKVNNNLLVFLNVGIYSGFIDVVIKKHLFVIEPLKEDISECELCYLCGNTSDISDVLGKYSLPVDTIEKKEKLIIRNCGAYCMQMYTKFSGHKPCIIKEI